MAARIVELCQAVVDHLENSSYSYRFTLTRTYNPRVRLEDTNETQIFVYPSPAGKQHVISSRYDFAKYYSVDVHICNYLDTQEDSEIDAALELAEEIEDSFANTMFDQFTLAEYFSSTSPSDFFMIEQLDQANYYHVVIRLMYRGVA